MSSDLHASLPSPPIADVSNIASPRCVVQSLDLIAVLNAFDATVLADGA